MSVKILAIAAICAFVPTLFGFIVCLASEDKDRQANGALMAFLFGLIATGFAIAAACVGYGME